MNKDNMYVFDKLNFVMSLLGEIQTEYNFCQTIDGSKDSANVIVINFSDVEIEPYSICFHEQTNTWWIVSHDKIERSANENGYIYKHNLELLGAVELLNARDLTDCGFNDNTYTVEQFITRLFKLSNFEYELDFDNNIPSGFLDKNVDFIKTFENYTLLSALREFLDAYNCCAKLSFALRPRGNKIYIDRAILNILQKTGNADLEEHTLDFFNDVREIKSMDKDSFGTCVISNANNVISSQPKRYPSAGFINFQSNEYRTSLENCLIRLPSNVSKVNYLQLVATKMRLFLQYGSQPPIDSTGPDRDNYWCAWIDLCYEDDEISIKNIDYSLNNNSQQGVIGLTTLQTPTFKDLLDVNAISQEDWNYVNTHKLDLINKIKALHTFTFYDGIQYNPDNTFTKPNNVPYIIKMRNNKELILCSKEIKSNLQDTYQGISWERGKNIIDGFDMFDRSAEARKIELKYSDGGYTKQDHYNLLYEGVGAPSQFFKLFDGSHTLDYHQFSLQGKNSPQTNGNYQTDYKERIFNKFLFVVNYVPACDMKIKVDNQRDKNDIKIYNQNGKLTDCVALSKLINSYAKEISSDNIVRYGQYYNINDVPKVGSFVNTQNGVYVITNVSMTFYQNEYTDEQFGFFIDCEFNMSKYIATKSLMVSPNSNIRDYGIPQNYNVKRKQVYRDYYELSYELFNDANQETPYIQIDRLLTFQNQTTTYMQYTAFIRVHFEEEVDNAYDWFYQLDCSNFVLPKQFLIICDFQDNNIIGYSQFNREVVFDTNKLFTIDEYVNVPISYVDDKGKVDGLEILFINSEKRFLVDKEFFNDNGYTPFPEYDALMTQVFIPEELYEIALNDNYDFMIDETQEENMYEKDATEVPVFEYSCQIDDSEDVITGDNLLVQREDCIYFYSYVRGSNLTQNNAYDNREITLLDNPIRYRMSNSARIEYRDVNDTKRIYVNLYTNETYNRENDTWSLGTQESFVVGDDYAIFRHSYNLNTGEQKSELMFIAKKVPNNNISNNELCIFINHYKLK